MAGTPLATAFVRLRPTPGTFKKDATAEVDSAAPGMSRSGEKAGNAYGKGFSSKATSLISKASAVGLAVGVAAAVKSAADFQTQVNKLATSAGESQKNLAGVSKGILQVARDTGTATSELTAGAYQVESAGFHGASSLKLLKVAAEGAKSENADLGTVTDALTTVMNDFKLPVDKSANAMDGLISTVAHGKTTLELLSASMSRVLPTAAATGLSFGEVGGAMATLTGEGVSARLAATRLNSTILNLVSPNSLAAKSINVLSLSAANLARYNKAAADGNVKLQDKLLGTSHAADDVAEALTHHGLVAALQLVHDEALKAGPEGSAAFVDAMKHMLGGQNGLSVALELTGRHMATLKQNTDLVSEAYDKGGKKVDGYALVQDSLNFKLDKLKETVQTTGIAVGTELIPPLTSALTFMGNHTGVVTGFALSIGGLAIGVTALNAAVKGVASISAVVGGFRAGTAAVSSFSGAAVTAASISKGFATTQLATAAANTTFAVSADGAVAAVAELNVAEKASAITGEALAAVNPFVWVAGAVIGIGVLTAAIILNEHSVAGNTDALTRHFKATGYNISGYQALARQTGNIGSTIASLGDTVTATNGKMVLARGGAAGYATAAGLVDAATRQAAITASDLVTRLAQLQTEFHITQAQAEQLGVKAGVSGRQLGAAGTSGAQAALRIQKFATGAGQATIKQDQLTNATSRFTTIMSDYNSVVLEGQQDTLSWQQSQLLATSAIRGVNGSLDANTEAAQNAKQALLTTTEQASQLASHMATVQGNVGGASRVLREQITYLQQHGRHSQFAAQEIDVLRRALAALHDKKLKINVDGQGNYSVQSIAAAGQHGGDQRTLAKGGHLAGYGGGDRIPILAEAGETMVSKEHSRAPVMQAAFSAVGVPGYRTGGIVGADSVGSAIGKLGPWSAGDYNATVTIIEKATAKATSAAIRKALQAASSARFNGKIGGGVKQWSGDVLLALAMLGLPAGYLGDVLYQMQTESGGNPNAINLTDSNAAAGDPSRGLMQTIGSTFETYRSRQFPDDIYNPMANIFAALNYGAHNGRGFGTGPGQIGSGHGYANGGTITEPIAGIGMASGRRYTFGEAGDETVIPGNGSRIEKLLTRLCKAMEAAPAATAGGFADALNGVARGAVHRAEWS